MCQSFSEYVNKSRWTQVVRFMKKVTKRQGPTEQHQDAWQKYEKILSYRAKFCMTFLFLQNMIWMFNGKMRYKLSEQYMESDLPYNHEWTDLLFPYLKVAQIVLAFGRLAMVIMASKWPWLT